MPKLLIKKSTAMLMFWVGITPYNTPLNAHLDVRK